MLKNDVSRGKKQSFAICAVRGILAAIAILLAFFAASAALVAAGTAPEAAMGTITWIAAFLSSFSGAAIAVKSHGPRALVMALTVSGTLFALTLLGAAFSDDGGLLGEMTMSLFLALIAGGVLASFLSPHGKKSQKPQKSRRR